MSNEITEFVFPEELKPFSVFSDGSGKAEETFNWQMGQLAKRDEVISQQRAFARKYIHILAGLSWDLDLFEPEICIERAFGEYRYRRDIIELKDLADLFPVNKWKRVEPKYGWKKETERDWIAELDGITIRLKKAEFKPEAVDPWQGAGAVAYQKGR